MIDSGRTRIKLNGVLWRGKESPLNADELYADFQPHWWERAKIISAIKWDSPEMLEIHSARLFLGCTTGHASNVLIDATARLFSIDHADIVRTDGKEIDLLFQNVRPGTRAFDALHLPCTLEEATVREVFGESAAYYLERLRKWKRLYVEATHTVARVPA